MAKQRNGRLILLTTVAVVLILGLLIAVIVLATNKGDKGNSEVFRRGEPVEEGMIEGSCPGEQKPRALLSLLEVFDVKDGLDVTWFPDARNQADIDEAIKGKVHMLEIWVSNTGDSSIRTDAVSGIIDSLKSTRTGLKIKIDVNVEFSTTVRQVVTTVRRNGFNNPVIVTLPVFAMDLEKLLSDLNLKDGIMVNFDLTTECCEAAIGRGTIEYVDRLCRKLKGNTFVEVDDGNVLDSWENLRWLLDKNDNLMAIISANASVNNDTLYDILSVRNDIDSDSVLYNVDKELYPKFRQLASTAGSPLLYFDINPRDAGNILWSHNTDTWEQLNKATNGDVMMIEGDIMLLGQDTPNQTNIPIMAHDVGDYNNLTFEQWLDEIIKVDKGMKFDFKSLDAVRPALQITKQKRDKIKGPIWLNADILKGPRGRDTRLPAADFLEAIKVFPEATLSLGWTTVAKGDDFNLNYTMEMVQEMLDVCKTLRQPITFPVRAEQLVDSWNQFDWLLQQSRDYTLTVWTTPTDNVTRGDMDYIKQQAEASRIYFDLPDMWRPSFR